MSCEMGTYSQSRLIQQNGVQTSEPCYYLIHTAATVSHPPDRTTSITVQLLPGHAGLIFVLTLYCTLVLQGDLTDPLYFDFISYAQYAVIAREIPNGQQVFKVSGMVHVGYDIRHHVGYGIRAVCSHAYLA